MTEAREKTFLGGKYKEDDRGFYVEAEGGRRYRPIDTLGTQVFSLGPERYIPNSATMCVQNSEMLRFRLAQHGWRG